MNSGTRFWLILAALLVLVTVLAGGAGSDGPPLDPRSVNPDGTRGVVETLERLGADVELDASVPGSDATAALLIVDRLSGDDADRVESWVFGGGTLVVADPASRFASFRSGFASDEVAAGDCSIPWLAGRTMTGLGRTLDADGLTSCFGNGDESYLTIERRGSGTIATFGGPRFLTNENLSRLDNAYVATGLLAPDPDRARIVVLSPSLVEFGDQSLGGLVATRVQNAIIMLLASFGLYALFRMRRLGSVVREPQPVPIRGSELVLQAGVLAGRAKDPASAASVIRADFVRRWRRTLAVDGDQPERLANLIVTHVTRSAAPSSSGVASSGVASSGVASSGVPSSGVPGTAELLDALTRPVTTDEELLTVVRRLDAIDQPAQPAEAAQVVPPVASAETNPSSDPQPDQKEVSARV